MVSHLAKHFGLGALFGAGLGIGLWLGLVLSSNIPAVDRWTSRRTL